jgi:hypothetical protein
MKGPSLLSLLFEKITNSSLICGKILLVFAGKPAALA